MRLQIVLLLLQATVFVADCSKISAFLKLMAKYGEDKANEAAREVQKKDPNFKGYNQYLVVTMVTQAELDKADNMANLDELQKHDRVQFYINTFSKKLKEATGSDKNKPKHGELIFLYIEESSVETLESKLPKSSQEKDKDADSRPFLVMFSFYIPCACVPGCNFNCAEELGKFAASNRNKYRVIVGYDSVFIRAEDGGGGTDQNRALDFLTDGGIDVYRKLDTLYESVQIITPSKPSNKFILQEMFKECLIRTPLAATASIDQDTQKQIATEFVNIALKACVDVKNVKNEFCTYYGSLTTLNRGYLMRKMHSYIPQTVHQTASPIIESCFDSSLEQSQTLGYPTIDGYPTFRPITEQDRWVDIYERSKQVYSAEEVGMKPKCDRRSFGVESFCTKVSKNKNR